MAFDQSVITAVSTTRDDASLVLAWETTAPAGTVFHVYLGGRLAWHGTGTSCHLPWPDGRTQVDVGAVADDEELTDLSASLPAVPGTGSRVRLTWRGGTYLGPDLESFRVYGETTPGGGIVYSTPLATVPAKTAGLDAGGFGMGGFGSGGFGSAAGTYGWTGDPLTSGTWSFAVKPVDSAGNEGPAATDSVTVTVPPLPPARDADGKRLTYEYDSGSGIVTLNWLASPG